MCASSKGKNNENKESKVNNHQSETQRQVKAILTCSLSISTFATRKHFPGNKTDDDTQEMQQSKPCLSQFKPVQKDPVDDVFDSTTMYILL